MKRLVDIVGALAALALLSPVMLGAMLAVWLDDGRPVFFRQTRVGVGGRTFGMFKFRTMVRNASTIGPWHTASDDPRITRTGRFLRRSSIDELPQILNVLRGEMSLVGPRPDVPAQEALYTPQDWALRCSVRPGITGLAQALLAARWVQSQAPWVAWWLASPAACRVALQAVAAAALAWWAAR